jgi:hypothetical protein
MKLLEELDRIEAALEEQRSLVAALLHRLLGSGGENAVVIRKDEIDRLCKMSIEIDRSVDQVRLSFSKLKRSPGSDGGSTPPHPPSSGMLSGSGSRL